MTNDFLYPLKPLEMWGIFYNYETPHPFQYTLSHYEANKHILSGRYVVRFRAVNQEEFDAIHKIPSYTEVSLEEVATRYHHNPPCGLSVFVSAQNVVNAVEEIARLKKEVATLSDQYDILTDAYVGVKMKLTRENP